ncbi:hypothetical protein [Krasilnikoviella flava]|uniref:Carbonic anhydrase or acetyltransferase, isoleucine patch superfamily n=1 Tax=Krasilnikoviella flava TaxID=526729 RepID=A0A1T5LXB8_9MICO|nr:hypothetical protein [Krasilnikoviella flava]SKC80611.1 hypothetical protein SAMN04324258_4047 [Krasilnikoviella flava]
MVVGDVHVAAGARILHGAVLTAEDGVVVVGQDSVVMEQALVRGRSGHDTRIGAAVMVGPHAHVNGSTVEDEAFVATQILPPDRHDEIGAVQRELDFPGTVYGVGRDVPMRELVRRQSELYGAHRDDEVVPEPDGTA